MSGNGPNGVGQLPPRITEALTHQGWSITDPGAPKPVIIKRGPRTIRIHVLPAGTPPPDNGKGLRRVTVNEFLVEVAA